MPAVRVPSVTVAHLPDDVHLVDVREVDEWAAGHAPGAQHLPMSQLAGRLTEVPRDREVVVVCRSGHRSAHVVAYLRHLGWHNVHNLDGGMQEWAAASRPMVAEGGGPPQVL
ncbi:MAG: rhodanese-like domain-containing protein [Micromonosporaceae bacterium]|jgi:rhodanese-related sulfurtransferase